MSTPTQPLDARDMDELEAVLLPVATAVDDQNQNSNVASIAVVPSTETYFDYDLALAQDGQALEDAVAIPDNGNERNYAGVSDDSKNMVGRAQQTGKIRSEEELESIRRANGKIFSQNYHQQYNVKAANEWAKQRDREGLQMKNNYEQEQRIASEKAKANELSKQKQQQLKNTQGQAYQIKDYDCGSYETNEYKVAEYKSVYD